jgi:hypothetical protein
MCASKFVHRFEERVESTTVGSVQKRLLVGEARFQRPHRWLGPVESAVSRLGEGGGNRGNLAPTGLTHQGAPSTFKHTYRRGYRGYTVRYRRLLGGVANTLELQA